MNERAIYNNGLERQALLNLMNCYDLALCEDIILLKVMLMIKRNRINCSNLISIGQICNLYGLFHDAFYPITYTYNVLNNWK